MKVIVYLFLFVLITSCSGGSSSTDPIDDNIAPTQSPQTTLPTNAVEFPPVPFLSADLADLVSGELFYLNSFNSGLVSGPMLGNVDADNTVVSKSIPFGVENIEPGLKIEHVTISQHDSNSASRVIGVLANTSSKVKCGLDTVSLTAFDAKGVALSTIDDNTGLVSPVSKQVKVLGAIRKYSQEIIGDYYFDDCITPNSFVYFVTHLEIRSNFVAAVLLRDIVTDDGNYLNTDIDVIPVMYDVAEGVEGNYALTLKNNSAIELSLMSAVSIVLNGDGFPLGYFLTDDIGIIEGGAEASVELDASEFEGFASDLRVVFSIDQLYDW